MQISSVNNNLRASSSHRCKCGRYITIGEEKAGIGVFGYICPTCLNRQHSKPLTREEYYEQFKR